MAKERGVDGFFEVSWEVCNKVGGINTVLKSKAAHMQRAYGDSFFLIGPFFSNRVQGVFEEGEAPSWLSGAFEHLKGEGIICHFGKWLINGEPNTILIDFQYFRQNINGIKKDLWDNFRVDSVRAGYDYDEPVCWAYSAGKLLEKIAAEEGSRRIVCQFHEWLSGAGLLYLKARNVKIGTVFTTHATVLGRTLSSGNIDLYSTDESGKMALERLDLDKEAYDRGVESKHSLERESAKNASIFTTVSEITGMEAGLVLGRQPDVLLPNGLDMGKFPTIEERSIKHMRYKNKLREFVMYYFFPYYTFDLDKTLFYFMTGRYEFHDKGIDALIDGMAILNKEMIEEKVDRTIITFLLIPSGTQGVRHELLQNKIFFQDIKDKIEEDREEIMETILYNIIEGADLSSESIFSPESRLDLKKRIGKFKQRGCPPLCTHELLGHDDAIISSLSRLGLTNKEDDRVKVVFYPIYLTGADGLIDLNYYETILGMHLGLFPSVYEPWGYTPLETAALGVPSVTTDLAGYGRFIQNKLSGDQLGVSVIPRLDKDVSDAAARLADVMLRFAKLSKEGRMERKVSAKKLSMFADWEIMAKHYFDAHERAAAAAYDNNP